MRNVVLIIQARTGSTRLPGKVRKLILGKPMLAHQIERIAHAKKVDTIVVATTTTEADTPVAELAASLGVRVFRGSEHDVLARMYEAAKEARATTVVRITGDCPLMDPQVVDEVIERFEQEKVAYTLTPANYPEGLDCEVFSFEALEMAHTNALLPSEREHVTPYIRSHKELFAVDTPWKVGVQDNSRMHWSVDTQADFEFVTAIFESLYPHNPRFTKDDVLALLAQKPELLSLASQGTGYEGLAKSLEEDKKFLYDKTLLVIGCGSIGARHARNARAIGARVVLADPNQARTQALAQEIEAQAVCSDYKEALEKLGSQIDACIVATPSSMHLEAALYCARRGIHLFIEKPLATQVEGLDELVEVVREHGVVTMIGQSYRFHEGFLALKKLLDQDVVGKSVEVTYEGGQYLPEWHPKEDYRKEYTAQKKLGGGVMFTSMSHALDNIEWLFGTVDTYAGTKSRVGDLEIDVDDTCELSIVTTQKVRVAARFDFLARPMVHRMRVQGTRGVIEADFIAHKIEVTEEAQPAQVHTYTFEPNKRYVDELKHFLTLVSERVQTHEIDITQGKHLVDLMCDRRVVDTTNK